MWRSRPKHSQPWLLLHEFMIIDPLHKWDLTPKEARLLQFEFANRIKTDVALPLWRTLAAADVSFDRFGTVLSAGVVVVRAGSFEMVERVGIATQMTFPYVPGLLSFREIPGLLKAFERLKSAPDVVLYDGHGIAHPRRMGIASHLGLCLNVPTVGCAKTRLFGAYQEPGPNRGERSDLMDEGEVIGSVLRTKDRVKPLFVSPGHLCDLPSAVQLVLQTMTRYRLPIPTRMAHEYVNMIRKALKAGLPIPE